MDRRLEEVIWVKLNQVLWRNLEEAFIQKWTTIDWVDWGVINECTLFFCLLAYAVLKLGIFLALLMDSTYWHDMDTADMSFTTSGLNTELLNKKSVYCDL